MLSEVKEDAAKAVLMIDGPFLEQATEKVKTYLERKELSFASQTSSSTPSEKGWLIIGQISGKHVIYSMKLYFTDQEALASFKHKFKKDPAEKHKSLDLLKECMNLMIGHINTSLRNTGLDTKISVPLLAKINLDVTFEQPSFFKHKKTFGLKDQTVSFLLKHDLFVNEKGILKQIGSIDLKEGAPKEEDEVEFL